MAMGYRERLSPAATVRQSPSRDAAITGEQSRQNQNWCVSMVHSSRGNTWCLGPSWVLVTITNAPPDISTQETAVTSQSTVILLGDNYILRAIT